MASLDGGSAAEAEGMGTPGRGGGKEIRRVKAEGRNRPLIELPRDLQSMSALKLLQSSRAVRTPLECL